MTLYTHNVDTVASVACGTEGLRAAVVGRVATALPARVGERTSNTRFSNPNSDSDPFFRCRSPPLSPSPLKFEPHPLAPYYFPIITADLEETYVAPTQRIRRITTHR